MRLVSRLEGEFTVYAWQALRVVVWEGPLSLAGVHQLDSALPMPGSADTPCSIVHLLQGRTNLPSAEVRSGLERLSKTHAEATACTAVLDDREGFVAGAIKGLITGVQMIVRVRLEVRLFSDLKALASWLVITHRKLTGLQLDLAAVEEVLRAAHEEHR